MRRSMGVLVAAGAMVVAGLAAVVPGQSALGQSAAPPRPGAMVLFNQLNSYDSATNSVIGGDFEVVGSPVFSPGFARNAVGVVDDESYLRMSQTDFFGPDLRQGTVSMWLKKGMTSAVGYVTPLPGVFGAKPYNFETYYAIQAQWGDGTTGPPGLYFDVWDAEGGYHRLVDLAFNTSAVPAGQWVSMSFVWDLDGIKGSEDRMRLYRDGVLVDSLSDPIPGVLSLPSRPVQLAGAFATDRLDHPALMIDELRVREGAVTP